jgi:Ca2+:H+ antiporter
MTAPGHPLAASAQRALDGARAEAERLGSDAIGAEHILLNVASEEPGASVFAALGVPSDGVRERLASGIRKGRKRAEGEDLVLTSHARRLLDQAGREAKARGSELGAEHLLLAAFQDPRGTVAKLLNDAGVDSFTARAEVLRSIGAEPEAPPPPAQAVAVAAPDAAGTVAASTDDLVSDESETSRERRNRQREPRPPREPKPPREAREPKPPKEAKAAPPVREPREPREPRRERGDRAERATRTDRPPRDDTPASRPAATTANLEPRQPLAHLRRDRSSWGPLWRRVLLLAVPAAIVANMMHLSPVAVFALSCLAVLPLAAFMGDATEHLAVRTGPTVGGLLNATFGNAAELIIAIVALQAGLVDLVKASITGSILGNLLLILGLSLLAGGARRSELRFNRTAAGMSAAMLTAALVGLTFPALFHATHPEAAAQATELRMSEWVSGILIATYAFSLLFSLRTHRTLFGGEPHPTEGPTWGVAKAVLILGAATVGVAFMSEILVHATTEVTATLGLSEMFLGLIIIPLIGNAAEHATAIVVARKGQIDLALQIAQGSSTQIALLVAPLLVFIGLFFGADMNLVFTPFEVMAVGLATIVTAFITLDGESHWFEGVQLLAVYAMIAVAAFFI